MNATALSPNPAPAISRRTMLIAFVFCFLGLFADGVDLMFLAYSLNSLKAEFGLSNFEAGSLGSLTLAGMAVGGIYGGWCCDRFGRVRVVTWTIVLFSIGTALLGLTQNYWQFALIRFVASLGLGSLFVACNILMSECVGTKYRTTILAAMQAGWTVGYLVATLLAGQIIPEFGWRTLFFTAVAPALVCPGPAALGAGVAVLARGPGRAPASRRGSAEPRRGWRRRPAGTDAGRSGNARHVPALEPHLLLPAVRLLRHQQLDAVLPGERVGDELQVDDRLHGRHLQRDDPRQGRRRCLRRSLRSAPDLRRRGHRQRRLHAVDRVLPLALQHPLDPHHLRLHLRRSGRCWPPT